MMSLWDALRMNMMISYQELVRTFLSAGMGCTIVAEGMRHLAPSNVSFVVLEDLNIVQEWELVWRKDRCSEVLKSLINLI